MIKEQIAARYSKALFELGKENGNLVVIRDDFAQFWQEINDNNELKKVLFHHRILSDKKKKVINEIFSDKINEYVLNIVKLLIDKRRENFIELILDKFKDMVNREDRVLELTVVTAIPLKGEQKRKLEEKLNEILEYKIELAEEVDPAIIGGLILESKNHIIDGSIRNKLENMREKIGKIPVSKLGV